MMKTIWIPEFFFFVSKTTTWARFFKLLVLFLNFVVNLANEEKYSGSKLVATCANRSDLLVCSLGFGNSETPTRFQAEHTWDESSSLKAEKKNRLTHTALADYSSFSFKGHNLLVSIPYTYSLVMNVSANFLELMLNYSLYNRSSQISIASSICFHEQLLIMYLCCWLSESWNKKSKES